MHQCLLSTPRFSVEHRVIARPGARSIARDVVVHPGAVVILPLLNRDQIVMIRNHRYTVDEELWELPAGTMEPDEEPIQTAARELEEETGFRAGSLTPFAEFYTSPGVLTERMRAFVASELTPVGQRLEESERIVIETIPLVEAKRKLIQGELRDGKTIAVLGMFLLQSEMDSMQCEG